jgi:predicted permease
MLLLARASGRQKEIGIRIALGAGRGRLMRQLLTESLLLALAGGAVGWLVAAWGAGLAAALIPFSFSVDIRPDASVAIFILAVSVGAAMLFGLAPAWQERRCDIVAFLSREEQSRERLMLRNILVVAQLAISIVLVTAAGLFGRSLITARSVDLGFVPERKLLATPAISNAGYSEDEGRRFVREMLDRIAALPGVVGVSTTMIAPFQSRETHPIGAGTGYGEGGYEAGFNRVGPGYFQLMGIPIVAGREFARSDDRTAPPSVVVNQALAERLWPGQDPLGKLLVFGDRRWAVIGVVRNALYYEVGEVQQTRLSSPSWSPLPAALGPPSDR